MSETLELAKELIARRSVTPDDAGCQPLIAGRLEPLGFTAEAMPFADVDNLWLRRGETAPLLVLAGHTDVVPTGPEAEWDTPPFEATVKDGCLHGRGAADMKGGLAAMVTACERFLQRHPDHRGSIALLLTSDEEGPSVDGTVRVIETLTARGEHPDWCVIGEPTSERRLGDIVKPGRRGTLSAHLRVRGIQGHVAYPQHADNPVHRAAPALAELAAATWDQGHPPFPPTSFQISNIHAGTGAGNVIPGELAVRFNFRFSPAVTDEALKTRVREVLDRHGLDYHIEWESTGQPYLTDEGELLEAVRAAVQQITGVAPQASTGGGTSDGRFIAPTGAQVVEVGPINDSIHKIDEHVAVEDLDTLSRIYEGILERLLL